MSKFFHRPTLALFFALFYSQLSHAFDSAVVLLYHHVSSDTPPSTSISVEKFEEHMQYLKQNHVVLPLPDVIQKLRSNQPLPEGTVVITFDDGYRNILENGHPILRKMNFPYTIFINPELIGTSPGQLNWQQVKTMASEGVTFANHGTGHIHMLERLKGESKPQWLARMRKNIDDAEQLLEHHLGYSLRYFAYPYGEFDNDLQALIADMGYTGFGQHSGGIYSGSDFTALPRFPAASIYANMNTLKIKKASVAMPVLETNVVTPVVLPGEKLDPVKLTVDTDIMSLAQFACYYQGKPMTVEKNANQAVIHFTDTLPTGRSRFNCTAPMRDRRGVFHWYSLPWFVPTAEGKYLD